MANANIIAISRTQEATTDFPYGNLSSPDQRSRLLDIDTSVHHRFCLLLLMKMTKKESHVGKADVTR
jgi:hypothetical protein